jgi:hypothetical protein
MKTKGKNPYDWRYPVMYMKTDELAELSRDVIENKRVKACIWRC